MKKFIIKETKESFRSIHELRQHALIEQIKDYTLIVEDDKQMTEGISKERLIELRDGGSSPEFHRTLKWLVHNECTEINPWLPIEKMPDKGRFLVYMPEENTRKLQVAYNNENIKIIGNSFAFDLSKPTHWKELPEDPKGE